MIELLVMSRIVHKSPFRMYVLQGHESGNLETSSIVRFRSMSLLLSQVW
jgi:hypothetical protein